MCCLRLQCFDPVLCGNRCYSNSLQFLLCHLNYLNHYSLLFCSFGVSLSPSLSSSVFRPLSIYLLFSRTLSALSNGKFNGKDRTKLLRNIENCAKTKYSANGDFQVNITEKKSTAKGWMPSVGKQSTIALEYFSKYSMCGFKHTNRLCFAFKVEMCPRTV